MTRRTFGLGMSAVALSLLGADNRKGTQMTSAPPEPEPKKDDGDADRRPPYDDPNRKPGK